VNYILLILSMLSIVLQNGLFNTVSKRKRKTKEDTFYYNSFLYVVCFLLFTFLAIGKSWSFYSVVLGLLFGIITMLSNFFKMEALSKGPMHITILVTTSSMIIPAISGPIFFHEKFSVGKIAAVIVLIGFIYISLKQDRQSGWNIRWIVSCVMAFLFQGVIGILQKIHQTSVYKEELFVFLATAFLVSCVFSRVMSGKSEKRTTFTGIDYSFALICGVCTFTMNFINLKLSGILPSQLFFPLVNGGSILLTSIVSVVIFKEKLNKRQVVGIGGGLLALILLCLL